MLRRHLIALATFAASGHAHTGQMSAGMRRLQADPFALGIASGAPTADGFVLWTRLVLSPEHAATAHDVRWEIAHDTHFRRVVRSGAAPALPELGHSVHVEVQGLQPDRWYFYRFSVPDATSLVGRVRTAPAFDAMAARLRFAFASCQRWEHGYYAAWRHLADEHPDLVVFLGDYIYEYATAFSPGSPPLARMHTLRRAQTLADYRDRYALHKTDPDLQAAHRACPWLVTWDDHEVENDYAGLAGREPEGDFTARRSAAYQAFYEHMPLRASALERGLAGLGAADGVRVHERHAYGRLARFHVLDTRQFRDLQACRDRSRSSSGAVRPADCPELNDGRRSLLGHPQEAWLDEGLAADARDGSTRWTILAQQTLFSPRRYGSLAQGPVPTDSWDGYPAARKRLLQTVSDRAPRNTLLLGGDIHQNFVCNVHAQPDQPDSPVLASEFCGTSITSFSSATRERLDALRQRNPHILLANAEKRGYGLVDLTPNRCTTTLRVIDNAMLPDAGVSTLARFAVLDGKPGILPA